MRTKKILGILFTFVAFIGIFVGVYLIRTFIINRSQAAGTASVYLDPSTGNLPPNKTFSLKINSGASRVAFVRVVFTFNRQHINLSGEVIPSGIWTVLAKDDGTTYLTTMAEANATGKVEMVLVVPVDKTPQAPSGTFEIATVPLKAVTSSATQSQVTFDTANMEIVDLTNLEDMAISSTPLALAVGGGASATASAAPTVPPIQTTGNTYYVSSSGNDANAGTQAQPWKTIAKASSTMQPGDTTYVRAGTYQEKISPSKSGTVNNYISYSAYPNETVNISVTSGAAVPLDGRAYVVINGFTVDTNNSGSWVTAGSSTNHNTISNNHFKNSRDGAMGVNFSGPSYNKILNNTFEKAGANNGGGFDAIILQDGASHNLIEGNRFSFGEHTLIKVSKTATLNVIRGNYFQNDWEKDTETNDNAHHNLWEKNIFATTKIAGDGQDSPGIQFSSPNNIFRYNVFYGAQGGGFRPEGYSGEASAVQNSRIFNNVFYANKHAGIYIAKYESGPNLSGTIYKNNIAYKNIHNESASNPQQLFIQGLASSNLDNNKFIKNNFFNNTADENVIGHDSAGNHPVAWWQTNYPSNFTGNVQVDPKFVNAAGFDFQLKSDSPMRDAGDYLTKTTAAGSGSVITVEDALYFFDGYDITDGDDIIVGSNSPVRITSIDYTNNKLTVSKSLTWSANSPVSLKYSGTAPDMGAFEYGQSDPIVTPTPTAIGNPTATPTPTATATSAPVPTVTLKADDSNGPITIAYNSSATLSWTSSNATSCTASGAWSGSKATSGSQSTANLTTSKTYTITCTGSGGTKSDSVVVNVSGAPTITPTPTATGNPTATPTPTGNPTATPTPTPTAPAASVDPRADINGDKKVNLLDYIILLENYGKTIQ